MRGDKDGAEALFKRALKINPYHADHLCNYAGFLLSLGRTSDGFNTLDDANSFAFDNDALTLESQFYRFAHDADLQRRQNALADMKKLINNGSRSTGTILSKNVGRARKDKHPEIDLVDKLSRVIADKADASTLDRFQVWRDSLND